MKNLDLVIKNYASIFNNIAYLGVTQLINFASPLLITPYLIHTIGVGNFGTVMLAQAVMSFVVILTEYGFNLTATQVVSLNRSNTTELSRLYSDVTSTRFVLVLTGLLITISLTLVIPVFARHRVLFMLSYFIVVGRALVPVWFFTGIEKMRVMAYFNVTARLITYVLILFFVRTDGDYYFVNVFWGLGDIVAGVCCTYYLKRRLQIDTSLTLQWQPIRVQLREGWAIFLTNGLNSLYINSSLLILSLFASEQTLGIYAVAEKLMLLVKQIYGVITQATYPYACRLAASSQIAFNRFLKAELYGCFILFAFLGAGLYLFADQLVSIFVGKPEPEAATLLRYLCFVPLIVSLNLPTYHALIINHFKESYLSIIAIGAVVNLVVSIICVPAYLANGTVIAIFATELFVTISFHIVLYHRHPAIRMQYV